jgi:hypothetical protein
MTALNGHETAGEIEQEAEIVRARLAQTLDQLRDNLTPQHLADEVLGHARQGAATLLETLSATAMKHPLPALLIGAGCAAALIAASGIARAAGDGHGPAPVPYAPAPHEASRHEPEATAQPATARSWAAFGERPVVTAVLGMMLGRFLAAALPRG